jgi:iron(III) transport system ATP-binding protein
MPTSITIENISKQYPGAPTPVIPGIHLRIAPGELFFLLGPSGCGKTTLLRMIAGFIEPSGGKILFQKDNGQQIDVTHLPPNKRNTGMVFQSYALWPHMSVAQNVAFGLEIRKLDKAQIESRVREALDMVQMGQYAQRKPNALSGGQQQRVALARALVVRPDVLLLDEPLSNLDAKLRVELRSEIRRICKSSGITTVYVTHDQKEALSMADQVAIMQGGQVVQLGPASELYRRPRTKFVAEFLGETNFLPAQVLAPTGPGTYLGTPAGVLISNHPSPPVGMNVLVSLRPEAIHLAPANINTFGGVIADSTYLGEIAQHLIDIPGPHRLKVAQLNPAPIATHPIGSHIPLSVSPEDVVMVPMPA